MIANFNKFNESNNNAEWTQNTIELTIFKEKIKSFDKFLKKLIRYSKTLGFPLPKITEKGEKYEYVIKAKTSSGDYNEIFRSFNKNEAESKLNRKKGHQIFILTYVVVDLTIVDEIKPLKEWEILGTIDHKDGIIKPAPNKHIPTDLVSGMDLYGKSNCDHCRKTIRRNKTVFVKNEESGEIKQIGGTCTSYYLGLDYQKIIQYLESIHMMDTFESTDEYEHLGEFVEDLYGSLETIKVYLGLVKKTGVNVSKKMAESKEIQSTSSKVLNLITFKVGYGHKSQAEIEMDNAERLRVEKEIETYTDLITDDEVDEFTNFIKSKKDESNFMLNAFNKIEEGFVTERALNYVTGACSFYTSVKLSEKSKKEAIEKRGVSTLKHIGEVGKKSGFINITVTDIKTIDTQYGMSNIYTMEDKDGNILTKFGTIGVKFITDGGDKIEKGTELSFTADIKRHDSFRGTPQTLLGRLSKYNPKL